MVEASIPNLNAYHPPNQQLYYLHRSVHIEMYFNVRMLLHITVAYVKHTCIVQCLSDLHIEGYIHVASNAIFLTTFHTWSTLTLIA